ncbi:hypothetical protein B6D60_03725 [candidate division KSB1 bacterium 4484_87]|nr:MAG: hypothetical protein B6D60_03725 [candidate division KSB1 bacterium 4484_87]
MRIVSSAIVMSDLHLGRELSYLDTRHPSYEQNRRNFLEILEQAGEVEELIINGDLFEVALEDWDEVCEQARAFFDVLAEVPPPQRIVYIPGNHDHHLWQSLVERYYIFSAIKEKRPLPDRKHYPLYFVDRKFTSTNPNHAMHMILPDLWPDKKSRPEFIIKYPHHLLGIETGKKINHYFFTHGHFLEPWFRPLNFLVEPARIDELEGFNALWLESFNYHLGHASRLSERVMAIIASYEQGYKNSKKRINRILNEIFLNIRRKTQLGDIGAFLLKVAMKFVLRYFPKDRNFALFQNPVDKKMLSEINTYLEKYIFQRYKPENYERLSLPSPDRIPVPFTFVFGHTHRPNFAPEDMAASKIKLDNEEISVLNTGGWLRIDSEMQNGENAGILLINSNGQQWLSLSGKLH